MFSSPEARSVCKAWLISPMVKETQQEDSNSPEASPGGTSALHIQSLHFGVVFVVSYASLFGFL